MYGWRGGAVSYSGIGASAPCSAARAATPASSHNATDSAMIQKRYAPMYAIATPSSASAATTAPAIRLIPRWVNAHHSPAAMMPSPTTPMASRARLRSPAKINGTSRAATTASRAPRAAQRRPH